MLKIAAAMAVVFSLWFARANGAEAHVQPRMIANVASIQPGKTFLVGVEFTIDPGWHIYWKNPGDAGSATKVKFSAPEGFVVGEMRYATPVQINDPGEVYYGYKDVVLLTAEVTAPKELPKDFEGKFSAQASWLVCQDVCMPGKQKLEISLSAGDGSPVNKDLFENWTSQIPVPVASSPDVANVAVSGAFVLDVNWKTDLPTNVQFLPGSLDVYKISGVKLETHGHATHIMFNVQLLAGQKPADEKLAIVVGYVDKDGRHKGVETSIQLPGNMKQ